MQMRSCNVSGTWCWLPAPNWPPFAFVEQSDSSGSSNDTRHFNFSSRIPQPHPGAPWTLAHGELLANGSVYIDYGCGTGPPCQVRGRIDSPGCGIIAIVGGSYSRRCPTPDPSPPPLPEPRTFGGDVSWLGAAAIHVLGSSQQLGFDGAAARALFTPNMRPGGYDGEFNRDYT